MVAALNADELLKKYQILLAEHKALLEENEILKARLRIIDPPRPATSEDLEEHLLLDFAAPELSIIPRQQDPAEKIRLFMSFFKGREDVYAKRWQNRQGKAGYAPVCRNEWKSGLCRKPAV